MSQCACIVILGYWSCLGNVIAHLSNVAGYKLVSKKTRLKCIHCMFPTIFCVYIYIYVCACVLCAYVCGMYVVCVLCLCMRACLCESMCLWLCVCVCMCVLCVQACALWGV